MKTPSLGTSRLLLVPHRASLVTDEQVKWLNDPEVVKYSEQRHKKHTLESQHSYLNAFGAGEHIWLIHFEGKPIGTITAYIDEPNGVADMGIMIGDRGAQRQGFGEEAWTAVMKWLFTMQGVRKVTAGMMNTNFPMREVAKRCGMEVEGVQADHFMVDGRPIAKVTMARFRNARSSAVSKSRTGPRYLQKQ